VHCRAIAAGRQLLQFVRVPLCRLLRAVDLVGGALVLSRYARRSKTVTGRYTPYSLLRSIENLLGYQPVARARSAHSIVRAALR
jgi:hypothetical protein